MSKFLNAKTLNICLCLLLAVGLTAAGCGTDDRVGGGSNASSDASADYESSDASDDSSLITVGFSQIGAESDWRIAESASIQNTLTVENGYNLIFENGQQKQENQLKAIREFVDQKVDYIILDPIVESGWDSALEEARDAGIPVIIVDREVEVEDESLYVSWVGSDFYLEGVRCTKWLEAFLEKEGYGDEEINIVDIQGTLGSSAQIGRTKALEDAIDTHGNWNLLAQEEADFVQARGKEVTQELIEKYGDKIDVLYCENDSEAYGALEAIGEAGYQAGYNLAAGEIMVLSFDAAERGLTDTKNGVIAVDTECNPLYGETLSSMIKTLEKGGTLLKTNYVREAQFSAYTGFSTVIVDNVTYPVTFLTDAVMETREY
ncbi:MAG: ABC transporter substrate-binding protein [Eubacterium sp.]|nr:ABC transporter substrate-binding protein [Eubacterium sp.]